MLSDKIPHDDFAEGFKVGYQSVKGATAALPFTPSSPLVPLGMTPFLLGVQAGIKAAGGKMPS